MGRTYRTAQGKNIDLEKLKLQHELVQAVGNMRVNARGDQLGAGGEVVRAREEMIDQHYQANVAKRRNVATEDVIPTQAGKVDKPKPVPALKAKKKQPIPDPVEVEVAPEPIPDPVASTPKGPALKGGLARAVAKTQAYENKKNKPKRI
jgi:hypothetical protein